MCQLPTSQPWSVEVPHYTHQLAVLMHPEACLIEDPATKRKLPRNYLETLEERVEHLESLLQQSQSQVTPSAAVTGSRELGHPAATSIFTPINNDETDDNTDLVSKAGVLSLHASGAEPYYFGSSSIFSFSRVIHACVRQAVQEMPHSELGLSLNDLDPSAAAPCRLPSYEAGEALSQAYFENVHFQYPFLHEPTFRQWEGNVYHNTTGSASSTELFFVNMVYAIGALLKASTKSLPQQLYASALLHIDHMLAQKNLESIQALLFCALNLSGLALRLSIELGYHRNVAKLNLRTNSLKLELRKRVFWCAYQLDCASSINLGLPLSLPIAEVDTEFPLDIDDSSISQDGILGLPRQTPDEPATTTSHGLHQFRIRCIWAHIYASLYSLAASQGHGPESYQAQVSALRKELDDWMAETPPEPCRSGTPITVFASIEDYKITYNESIILLYRGQLTKGSNEQSAVLWECMTAATSICHPCKRLYIGKPINYTWSTLHVIFMAGLTTLHCLWTSSTVRQAARIDSVSSTFTNCTMLLAIMAERWEGAAPYRDLFEALSSRAMAMVVEQNRDNGRVTVPAPAGNSENPNTEDLEFWASQIADFGMPDTFSDLLSGLVNDYSPSAANFQDNLWEL
ncbi:subtilisin-like protease [Fusarium oxysporum f. sp. phaseoli]